MRKYIIISLIIIFNACSAPIRLPNLDLSRKYSVNFLNGAERNNFINEELADSLVLKWERTSYGATANSSFAVIDKYLFYGDLSGRIYSVETETGKTKNEAKYKGSVTTNVLPFNNKLIYALNNFKEPYSTIFVHEIRNNKIFYEHEIKGRLDNHPLYYNDKVFYVSHEGEIITLDALGNIEKSYETKYRIKSSPAGWKNTIIIGNDNGEVLIYDYSAESLKTNKISKGMLNTPAVDKNRVYFSDTQGYIICYDLVAGVVLWKHETGTKFLSSVVYDDKHVYVGNLDGMYYKIDKSNGNVVKSEKKGTLFNTTSLVFNNYIVQADIARKVYIFDKTTFNLVKTIETEKRVRNTPFYLDGILYIGFDKGVVQAYRKGDG